jgi:hypothetical protein
MIYSIPCKLLIRQLTGNHTQEAGAIALILIATRTMIYG